MMTGVVKIKYFIDRLIEKVKIKKSHLCVGLDPHPERIPKFLLNKARNEYEVEEEALGLAIWWFNREIIDKLSEIVVAVKPQLAFYEMAGPPGLIALKKTVDFAKKKGLIVIMDGKRNDISSSAQAYAGAYLKGNGNIQADAITINPYLGYDGIKPFIENKESGAFALVKTSNKSSGEIQDLKLESGEKLHQRVGKLVSSWGKNVIGENGYSNLGAVIGATYPDDLKELRRLMDTSYFLIPGYGIQGGKIEDAVHGFDEKGLGALINSSRSIIFAFENKSWKEEEFGLAARNQAQELRDLINKNLERRKIK